MNKKIRKLTAPIFIMSLLLLACSNNTIVKNEVEETLVNDNSVFESDPLLQLAVDRAHEIRKNSIGYPVNQDIELDDFYKWYTENDIDKVSLNNAGDPFNSNINLGLHDIEKAVIEFFAPLYGYSDGDRWGIVTASGTDGNNHGIYFGRKYLKSKSDIEPILYVSTESHYSNKRLADLQQIECRLIRSDPMGRMIPEEFENSFDPTRPALIIYSMGTTFKGGIDDIKTINEIIDKYDVPAVYRHVDAALFGGYIPFSDYSYLLDRNDNKFDSIAISGHKFFGIDEPCGIFLTTNEILNAQSSFATAYLNGSMPMINCSRSATNPLKFYWMIKKVGKDGYKNQANQVLENAKYLKSRLDEIEWPSWIGDYSNTVFFKRPSVNIMDKYFLAGEYDDNFGGELAHIVVMQNLTKEKIDMLIEDLKLEIQ